MATSTDSVFRVLEPFAFDYNGRAYVMRRGDIVAGDNPAYRGRERLFEEVTAEHAREAETMRTQVSAVETATAAPGEVRRMEIDTPDPVVASVPPGPSTPAPTGDPAPAPTPPTPAPTGKAARR